MWPSDGVVQHCTATIQWSGAPTALGPVFEMNTLIMPAPNGVNED